LLGLVCWLAAPSAWSDCGSIPFYALVNLDVSSAMANLGDSLSTSAETAGSVKKVDFDPLQVVVFEPKQRAIILWNGQEEVLLLSTDQRASQRSAILEVIPLPAEPKVRLGSFETFEAAQRLVIDKRMWVVAHAGAPAGAISLPDRAGRITFQEKMGAHDLAIAKVVDRGGFTGFVQKYLQDHYQTPEAPIRPDFLDIIQDYVDDGFAWFAFDVITLDEKTEKSREPIEYRFKSDHVFYPLRISRLEQGRTEVDLLVFSEFGATDFRGLPSNRIDKERPITVSAEEVGNLAKEWSGFFGKSSNLTMNQWRVEDNSADLDQDIVAW
jgi:hypothetical protein